MSFVVSGVLAAVVLVLVLVLVAALADPPVVITLLIVESAPNAERSAEMPASFLWSAAVTVAVSLPLSRSSTFTSCTFDALTWVSALIESLRADAALIARMSEPKLGCIATSPIDVVVFGVDFRVVSCACERDGVAIAATAAVAMAVRRVRVCIGDSCIDDAPQRGPALPVLRVVIRLFGPSPGTEHDRGHIGRNVATNSRYDRSSFALVMNIT